ncbi:hypothetical protein BVRB_3g057630 [Beta vulgaris subsp. vulgaris]|nr:hypothetical protein BVRB_3g057630 [Beta vulgaris subsp. vulgaris]
MEVCLDLCNHNAYPSFEIYTTITPLADRVLIKIKEAEEKTSGGILLPSRPQLLSVSHKMVRWLLLEREGQLGRAK